MSQHLAAPEWMEGATVLPPPASPKFARPGFSVDHALKHALSPGEAWRWFAPPNERPAWDTASTAAVGCAERRGNGHHGPGACGDFTACAAAGASVAPMYLDLTAEAWRFGLDHPQWMVLGKRSGPRGRSFWEYDIVAPTGVFVAVDGERGLLTSSFRPNEVPAPRGDSPEDLRLDRLARVWNGAKKLRAQVRVGGRGPSVADLTALLDELDALALGEGGSGPGPIRDHATVLSSGDGPSEALVRRLETL